VLDGIIANTQTLSSAGAGSLVIVWPRDISRNMPGIICIATGTLTYNVEVTCDDITAPNYVAANGNWAPMSSVVSGATATVVTSLGAVVTAIRPHITSFSSGSLVFQFGQVFRT